MHGGRLGGLRRFRRPRLVQPHRRVRLTATDRRASDAGISYASPAMMTVAAYVKRWPTDRKRLGLRSVPDDTSRMNLHVLPHIGGMELHEVRPRHLRELVLRLREKGKLAPRTIHHVYHLAATLFRTAVAEELIEATPCVLQRGFLPKKVDKDPTWRVTAIYTREEIEKWISDRRIAEDRRVPSEPACRTISRNESSAEAVPSFRGPTGPCRGGADANRTQPSRRTSSFARARRRPQRFRSARGRGRWR